MNVSHRRPKTRKRTAVQAVLARASTSGGLVGVRDVEAPPAAACKALARLAQSGRLIKVSKGLYYAPKETPLGPSRPGAARILLKRFDGRLRPTGYTAAHLLGLSTQLAAKPEYVLYASALPDAEAIRLTLRRGARPPSLPDHLGALIEVLRDGGRFVELAPDEATARLLEVLSTASAKELRRLTDVAAAEPPRVRAILGALLAGLPQLSARYAMSLRASLNPLSRFDFGLFSGLPNAREWQAK